MLAATYDASNGLLVVLDEQSEPGTGKTARLLAMSTRTGQVTVRQRWPRRGLFSHFELAASGHGTYVLVGQMKGDRRWKSVRFSLLDGQLRWVGHDEGAGLLLRAPFASREGVRLVLAHDGGVAMPLLGEGRRGQFDGWEAL